MKTDSHLYQRHLPRKPQAQTSEPNQTSQEVISELISEIQAYDDLNLDIKTAKQPA